MSVGGATQIRRQRGPSPNLGEGRGRETEGLGRLKHAIRNSHLKRRYSPYGPCRRVTGRKTHLPHPRNSGRSSWYWRHHPKRTVRIRTPEPGAAFNYNRPASLGVPRPRPPSISLENRGAGPLPRNGAILKGERSTCQVYIKNGAPEGNSRPQGGSVLDHYSKQCAPKRTPRDPWTPIRKITAKG